MGENSEKRKILLIGGGGHCRSVCDSIRALKIYDEIGIVRKDDEPGTESMTVGSDADLPRLKAEGWTEAVITVGSVGDVSIRRRLYELVKGYGFHLPVVADPSAVIAADAKIAEGCYIGKKAVVNAGSKIGCNVIINTGALVEHDCCIGDHAHVSTGAILCGGVSVGPGAHIGAGSIVRQGLSVGENALTGIGSVVVSDVPGHVVAYGNPCRIRE